MDINEITIQKEEVEEVRWVSVEELKTLDISTTCQYIKDNIDNVLTLLENIE